MKGKTILAVPISMEESMLAGTEVEILQESTLYYRCRIADGRLVSIEKSKIAVTEFTKTIDWEQRRYEIAREVLASRVNYQAIRVSDAVSQAIRCADELIKQLKGEQP